MENVGNLICPVSFDLGQDFNVGLLSVPEGHDKPYKYPGIFEAVDLVVVTKSDLLPYLDFEVDTFRELVHGLNPDVPRSSSSRPRPARGWRSGWRGWKRGWGRELNMSSVQEITARHITITGVVQGVGFRPFVYNLAYEMGMTGWVLNHSGGVDIEIEGPAPVVAAFVVALRTQAPPLSHIETLEAEVVPPRGFETFEIRHSESQEGRYQLISPDVATCPDCLRELFDPQDRRYRYPFINCTNCGPRFTIIKDIPYDRPRTTMDVFPLCDDCRREYEDPRDRRFHAQPNACPVCGPQVWLVEADDRQEKAEAVPSLFGNAAFKRAVSVLQEGKVLAIKGLGGFHLACDATNPEAVALLRERKRRPHKPFAIMAPTVENVKELCEVPREAEAVLTSPQCPIVLLDARPDNGIAENVAPNSHMLGVMIPYTPVHHILLRDMVRPLVMTSGNLSEEPIAMHNDEALHRLASLADAFLLHNRDIHARYDDSVVAVGLVPPIEARLDAEHRDEIVQHGRQMLRRARGYAPFPVRLPFRGAADLCRRPFAQKYFHADARCLCLCQPAHRRS